MITSAQTWPQLAPCDRSARQPAGPSRHFSSWTLCSARWRDSHLRAEGDSERFQTDARYRWLLHRLWIAAGNEASAYTAAVGRPVRATQPWADLYELRNHLAHHRLPDIDEALVQRVSWLRLDGVRRQVREALR